MTVEEEAGTDQESTPSFDALDSRSNVEERPVEGSPDYDTLMRRYGEAMLRIGQLEAQVDGLSKELQGTTVHGNSAVEPTLSQDAAGMVEFLARIEALEKRVLSERIEDMEKRLGISTESESGRDGADKSNEASSKDRSPSHNNGEEIAGMRFHIANLVSQLSKPESTEGRPWGQPLKKLEGAPLNLG